VTIVLPTLPTSLVTLIVLFTLASGPFQAQQKKEDTTITSMEKLS
jgi:hypothetical protein